MTLRLVHACHFCGRERRPEDLRISDINGRPECRTDHIACLALGWQPKEKRTA